MGKKPEHVIEWKEPGISRNTEFPPGPRELNTTENVKALIEFANRLSDRIASLEEWPGLHDSEHVARDV